MISFDILNAGEPFDAYLLDKKQTNKNGSLFNVSLEVRPSRSEEHEQEIFVSGTAKQEIVTYREHEHDLLMSIRSGEMPFEKIFTLQEKLERELVVARSGSKLPETANMAAINDMLGEIYAKTYGLRGC